MARVLVTPYCFLFPQYLVEGLLHFRGRACRSFWLHFAVQDPPIKRANIIIIIIIIIIIKLLLTTSVLSFIFPQEVSHRKEEFLASFLVLATNSNLEPILGTQAPPLIFRVKDQSSRP